MTDTGQHNSVMIDGLSFSYPGGPPVLNDIRVTLAAGECVGLVGPSGAGKSTLLMHLNGLLPEQVANNGATITINGTAVDRSTLRAIRRDVGLVFQDPNDQLFCPTVADEVAFGPLNLGLDRRELPSRIAESLRSVGMEGFERRSTIQLSEGERKRVCIAGVLACRPSILALDEPSNGLDPRARRQLVEILRQFEGTRILATHDLDLVAELCSRTLVLDNGRIEADGPTADVLSDDRLMDQHGLEVPLRIRFADGNRHP